MKHDNEMNTCYFLYEHVSYDEHSTYVSCEDGIFQFILSYTMQNDQDYISNNILRKLRKMLVTLFIIR